MTDKQLKPYTVVPPHLYVERDADRQLRTILQNGGRPGYVLVARQMGKTNLLLNAKRSFSGAEGFFAYLDASNPFPDVRTFFRNIVDVIAETSEGEISSELKQLISQRDDGRLPHKEHEYELRAILRLIEGKLVVCIDEIDALTKSAYSDEVFSFIRSTYFAGRANFPEFSRLTYLLSGVAEPAEIIKNKDISPFNIGDKIYLNDFSTEELKQLIQASSLPELGWLNEAIYSWTGGHPRMSWDLISALEDICLSDQPITTAIVESTVERLYFSDVDVPPIDHIKRLAEESHEVRDALMAMHYSRSSAISDSTRTRLYLSGISKGLQRDGGVSFKNKILEEALSEEYILSLEETDYSTIGKQIEEFVENGRIEDAIEFLAPKLSGTNHASQTTLRRTYLRLLELSGNYLQIVSRFEAWGWTVGPAQDDRTRLYYAKSLAQEQRYVEAFTELEKLESSDDEATSIEATLAMVSASLKGANITKRVDIRNRCEKWVADRTRILSCQGFDRSPPAVLVDFKYWYAKILIESNDNQSARVQIIEALEFATLDAKVRLRLLLATLDKAPTRALTLDQVLREALNPPDGVKIGRGDNELALGTFRELLIFLSGQGKTIEIEQLVNSVFDTRQAAGSPYFLTTQLVEALPPAHRNLMKVIFERVGTVSDLSLSERRTIYGALIRISGSAIEKYSKDFLSTFNELHPVQLEDLAVLNSIIINSANWQNQNSAHDALALITSNWQETQTVGSRDLKSLAHLIEYLRSLILLRGSPSQGNIAIARSVSEELRAANEFTLPNFEPDYLVKMRVNLFAALSKFKQSPRKRTEPKIQRNSIITVDYGNGPIAGKYKKFENDIKSGRCQIVNVD